MGTSGRAEERIDGRTVAVLVRAIHGANSLALYENVPAWRRNVHATVDERFSVGRVDGLERAITRQD
jgi:hypothetical protein